MDSQDLFQLPPAERAARYRELAGEMRCRADNAASDEFRDAYLSIAEEWLGMAGTVEAEYGKVSVSLDAPELASLLRRNPSQ